MTATARRRTYWILFAISCLCFVVSVPVLVAVSSDLRAATLVGADAWRVRSFLGARLSPGFLAPMSAVLAAACACGIIAAVLSTFRKTVSAEMYFSTFWAATLALEVLRPIGFLLALRNAPVSSQMLVEKALLASRYTGSLCMFVSGLLAAGLRSEKPGYAVTLVAAISVALASLMPINNGPFTSSLTLRSGYSFLNEGFYAVIIFVTVLNYFIAARTRSERSYRLIALGAFALLAGNRALVTASDPVTMLAAFLVLGAGALLYVWKIHAYYLWQ